MLKNVRLFTHSVFRLLFLIDSPNVGQLTNLFEITGERDWARRNKNEYDDDGMAAVRPYETVFTFVY